MLLIVQNLKISRGEALDFVMLITGLLAGSVNAATIEEEIWVSLENTSFFVFTVEEPGMIYAEAKLEVQVGEPFLILDFLSSDQSNLCTSDGEWLDKLKVVQGRSTGRKIHKFTSKKSRDITAY